MDMFVINRYLAVDSSGDQCTKEKENLQKLLQKIEERRKQKKTTLNALQNETGYITESSTMPQGGNESESVSKKKKKKRKLSDANEADREDVKNMRITETGDVISNDAQTDLIKVDESYQSENEIKDSNEVDNEENLPESEFTVLGSDSFAKKQKVKRVLPSWLANPSVVSVNLKELHTTVDDIGGLDEDIVAEMKENHITHLFPVQAQVIPWLLSSANKPSMYWPSDICVSAPTGSGKTLAFVLPIVQILRKRVIPCIRALIILPVQDLATQVYKVFKTYCSVTNLKVALITGQKSFVMEQQQLIKINSTFGPQSLVDIVVTTPGRLVDHLKSTPNFSLKHLRFLVIDEADRVMECIQNDWLYHVNKNIYGIPDEPLVGELRGEFIGKYTTPAELKEKFCIVTPETKPLVLYYLITSHRWKQVLCFVDSQRAAHRLSLLLKHLSQGNLTCAEMSSVLWRQQRDEVIRRFVDGQIDILISTDALARGMDMPNVKYVISYDLPKYIKNYIHRIGRTGRAGKSGKAITLILQNQVSTFQDMLKTAGKNSVRELVVSEDTLLPFEEQYKSALGQLKQDMEDERNSLLQKMKEKKTKKVMAPRRKKLKLKQFKPRKVMSTKT
ncbi:probable ATP-dependent RNA helicase Dbp73D isoform X2 [Schistocerca piceifrons]|uniref:probable ATP-dependent RNA helicase Dbp73D isoform X2 n=1 Tax=Schistocerca piceifrons TaxID=274613 RepID=UPI001F5F42DB|nr:probable ATP-dependent RNA helicase Dbp73D isoform X2 [Schistocerca piceifrons]